MKHIVNLIVSQPDHDFVSMRSRRQEKTYLQEARSPEEAVNRAVRHYRTLGWKVHSATIQEQKAPEAQKQNLTEGFAGSPYSKAYNEVAKVIDSKYHKTALNALKKMAGGADEAETFGEINLGAGQADAKKILKKHGIMAEEVKSKTDAAFLDYRAKQKAAKEKAQAEVDKSDVQQRAGKAQAGSALASYLKKKAETMKEETEVTSEYLEEKLTAGDSASKWIHDFVHSDNPKFEGKSKAERIKMALGAKYAADRAVKEEAEQVEEASMVGMPFTAAEKERLAKIDAATGTTTKVKPSDLEASLKDIPGRLGKAPRGSKALADMSDIKLVNKLTKEDAEQIDEYNLGQGSKKTNLIGRATTGSSGGGDLSGVSQKEKEGLSKIDFSKKDEPAKKSSILDKVKNIVKEDDQIDEVRNANLGNYLQRTGTNKPNPVDKAKELLRKMDQGEHVPAAKLMKAIEKAKSHNFDRGLGYTLDEAEQLDEKMSDAQKDAVRKVLKAKKYQQGKKTTTSDVKGAIKLVKEEDAEQVDEGLRDIAKKAVIAGTLATAAIGAHAKADAASGTPGFGPGVAKATLSVDHSGVATKKATLGGGSGGGSSTSSSSDHGDGWKSLHPDAKVAAARTAKYHEIKSKGGSTQQAWNAAHSINEEDAAQLDEKSTQAKQNKTFKNVMTTIRGARIMKDSGLTPELLDLKNKKGEYLKQKDLNKQAGRAAQKGQLDENDEGSTPKTAKEKELAAKAGDPNKITKKDVLVARGVDVKEGYHKDVSTKREEDKRLAAAKKAVDAAKKNRKTVVGSDNSHKINIAPTAKGDSSSGAGA